MSQNNRPFLFRLSPWTLLIAVIVLGGLAITVHRAFWGLGAVTNLNDMVPWGLWKGFNTVSGIALAGGGFTMAFLAHIIGDDELHDLVRPAILIAFLGYLMAVTGLVYELGMPWRIWHPIVFWNPHSVMFEVAWCVMLYTTVLALEFAPVVFEGLRSPRIVRALRMISLPLYILGIVLSTLHQASLGSLFLIIPSKLHALWYTPILPLLFFLSATVAGLAMLIVVEYWCAHVQARPLRVNALNQVAIYLVALDVFYLAVRIQDLYKRDALSLVFSPGYENVMFVVEILLLAIPVVLLLNSALRQRASVLLAAASMVVMGMILNRLDVSIVGILRGSHGQYLPSWQELWVSVFIFAVGLCAFVLAVHYLPVYRNCAVSPGQEVKTSHTMEHGI